MCIKHDPEMLKQWRLENKGKNVIVAYKIIEGSNDSLLNDYHWSIGKHKVAVEKLNDNDSGRGFYAYLSIHDAFADWRYNEEETDKVIAVHIKPKDVVYMGKDCDNYAIIVCRALEVKSLRRLRKPKQLKSKLVEV